MKKMLCVVFLILVVGLTSCETQSTLEETITCTGLEQIVSLVGEPIDFETGVICESNINGVVDFNVITDNPGDGMLNINDQRVYLIEYEVELENGDFYSDFRRTIVRNPELVNLDNLLLGGGSNEGETLAISSARHNDFPDDTFFNKNSDLNLLQIAITSVSESDEFPYFMFNVMELDSTKTYQLTFKIRGTEDTTIRMDVAEILDLHRSWDTTTIVDIFNVNVTVPSEGMIEFSTTFSPSITTTQAYLRIILGSTMGIDPSGEIHLDDFELIELP